MKIINRNPKDLISAEYNPRSLSDAQKQTMKDSIKRFGFVDPVIVNINEDRKDIIIGGHQRTKVAVEMGYEEVPTVELDLTLEREKELNIRLNKNTGSFDEDALREYFDKEALGEWGFESDELSFFEVEEEIQDAEEDDFDGEPPEEPKTELGRIYQLGEHRLMCGDSTKEEDVQRLMGCELADMVFTDPPYGIKHSGKGIDGVTVGEDFGYILGDNDTMVAINCFNLISSMFPDSLKVFWGANYYPSCLPNGNGWLIWDKEREGDTFSGGELAFVSGGVRVNIFRHKWHGMIKASEHGEKRVHPTQKPISLASWCFDKYNKNGVIVLDLFGGSGSTLIACEQTKRKCRMMELDPKYCDVIVNRYCKLKDIDPEKVFETGVA